MSKEEAIEWIRQICAYLTAGNPVWRNEPIIEACDVAIKAIEADPKLTDEIIAAHEKIGYEKGRADGYAEALEAEPKSGRWEIKHFNTEGNGVNIPFCTACGKPSKFPWLSDFCPNCGLPMVESIPSQLNQKGEAT